MLVPTWTPGEVIPPGKYDRLSPSGLDRNYILSEPIMWFVVIGMPIIGALLISSCVYCCVQGSKEGKRERALRAAARGTADAEGVAAARATANAEWVAATRATADAEGVPGAK